MSKKEFYWVAFLFLTAAAMSAWAPDIALWLGEWWMGDQIEELIMGDPTGVLA